MPVPVSARIAHAATALMPGISASRRAAVAKGMVISSIRSSSAAMSASIASTRASIFLQQERVMAGEEAGERLLQRGDLAAHHATRQLRQLLRVTLPADQGAQHLAARDTPKMSETTTLSLIWASSSSFSTRCFSAVRAATRSAR